MMTTAAIANAILSLILVICLILLTAQLFRWWQSERGSKRKVGPVPTPGTSHELDIIETRAVDFKRKLVLVRRGDKLHLLLCGDGRDIVIETGIPYQAPHEPQPKDSSHD